MTYTIQIRRDTTANWETVNPILHDGELGLEKDTQFVKVGDGVTAWNDLEYLVDEDSVGSSLPDATGATDGQLLGIQSEAWVIVDPPEGGTGTPGEPGYDGTHRGPWAAFPKEHIDFESGVIDPRLTTDGLGWTVYADPVTDTPYTKGLRSHNNSSYTLEKWVELVATTVSGTIDWRRLISMQSIDHCRFYIDGTLVSDEGGPSSPWTQKVFAVGAGTHTFRWAYKYNGTGGGGLNGFVFTDINYPSPPGENGYKVGDVVTYDGFEWRCNVENTGSTPGADLAWTKLSQDSVKTINSQTGTAYTLVRADEGKWIRLTNAAAIALTVPNNSSVAFPVGTQIEGSQDGAGQVTITPAAGVTINGAPGLKVAAQYGVFGLLKVATNTWLAYGRLSA